jgi:hypothetical protein
MLVVAGDVEDAVGIGALGDLAEGVVLDAGVVDPQGVQAVGGQSMAVVAVVPVTPRPAAVSCRQVLARPPKRCRCSAALLSWALSGAGFRVAPRKCS